MKGISVVSACAALLFVISCGKGTSSEDLAAPGFGKMTAVPELHSATLSCALTHERGITSCGVYLTMEGDSQRKDCPSEVKDCVLSAQVSDIYKNTKYYYQFHISNAEVELLSPLDSFTTLNDGPQAGCDYIDEWKINHGEGIVFGSTVWAPVNCGYHESLFPLGKFYQWGRKYGVGGEGVDVQAISRAEMWSGPNGQEDANTLYRNGSGSTFDGDWILGGDEKFWNSGSEDAPVKTSFDPCPQGWRVPTFKELEFLRQHEMIPEISTEVHGYWFQNENEYMYLTAGGEYDGTLLAYHSRKEKAFYWSSSHRKSLYFHISLIKMQECPLSDAQNVRCVQQ